jgi:RHS repeat-associated protein
MADQMETNGLRKVMDSASGCLGLLKRLLHTGRAAGVAGVVALGIAAALPVHAQTTQTVLYVHTDALGSVVAKTDVNGNVVERYDYEPYGAPIGAGVQDGPAYTGHVSDSATGLSYMQQRYMDPQLGVFLSVDPVTAYQKPIDQFNRYRYANGNPYRFTDPDGRQAMQGALPNVLPIYVPSPGSNIQTNDTFDGGARPVSASGARPTGRPTSRPTGRDTVRRGRDGQPVESSKSIAEAPALPSGLVGDQTSPLAGPNKSGNRHTSGNLAPQHGGSGDYDTDLKTLAGNTRPAVKGESAPLGAQVGENGVFGRNPNKSGGKSIDIPANGQKPHETLHY